MRLFAPNCSYSEWIGETYLEQTSVNPARVRIWRCKGISRTENIAFVKTVCRDDCGRQNLVSFKSRTRTPQHPATQAKNKAILLVTRRFGWLQVNRSALEIQIMRGTSIIFEAQSDKDVRWQI